MVRVSSVICEGGILNSTQIGANQSQGGALFASRTMLVPFKAGKQRSAGLSGQKQMEPIKPIFWANGGLQAAKGGSEVGLGSVDREGPAGGRCPRVYDQLPDG